ncbi:MAG: FHA domain-containing protein [Deltaproteobacteria bacterium]|nr:FHA domain-containing protein [Deltaproteobacteria bacterium]
MFTLTFIEPSGRREAVPLADEETGLVCGRDPGCDFVLQSKEVSRRHARFFVEDGVLHVEDLGSHNGVWIDGARAEGATPMPLGKEIELGDVRATASGSAKVKVEAPRAGVKKTILGADGKPAPAGSARAGAAAARQRAIEQAQKSGKEKPKAAPVAEGPPTEESPKVASKRPQPKPPDGLVGVGAGAALRGLGQASKVQIALPPVALVGRGKDCQVVLDDDSVSRQHAELYRDDRGLYRVRDLGSANGTFVDGRKCIEGEMLHDGAKVRFGDVELLFWRPPTQVNAQAARQRQYLIVGVVLLVGFGALFWMKKQKEERERQQAAQQVPLTAEDEARLLNEQAQGALSSDRFDDAVRLAQSALDKDPIASEPRKTLAIARREQAAKKTFDDAQAKAAVGNDDEAVRLFAQVDSQSRFFARARIKAKDLAQGVLRSHTKACLSEAQRERWESAASECAAALDVKCQMGPIEGDSLLKALRRAEHALDRRIPWSCPEALSPLFHDTSGASAAEAANADKALRARYPDDKVREAVLQYARGDLAGALRVLSSSSVTRGKSAALAAQAAEQMRLVEGRFREGQTAMLRNELPKANDVWREALAADATLLPQGQDSFYATQMRTSLTDAQVKAGNDKFAKNQYSGAFEAWSRALEVSPRDPRVLDSLARLERVAEDLITSGSCDDAQTALRITRADPPSPAHTKAQAASEKCR